MATSGNAMAHGVAWAMDGGGANGRAGEGAKEMKFARGLQLNSRPFLISLEMHLLFGLSVSSIPEQHGMG